tara:strand:+ start:662 stop:925 length:264 start_codon:yes stop_codon:yes gene_type:complete
MSLYIEQLKKKIIYRSRYRGSKEMDALLSCFVSSIINNLNKKELNSLLILLSADDKNLYNFRLGKKTNTKIDQNRITQLFKNYTFTK